MEILNEFLEVLGKPMAIFGIVGQTLFFSRFLVQWIASEKKKESTIPEAFWYLSIIGGLMTLVYAIWRKDPVFSLAQTTGVFVYSRNLILIHRKEKQNSAKET